MRFRRSRSIAFFAQGKLKRVAASGGPAQSICDANDDRGGSWNRDGVIVFAHASSPALTVVVNWHAGLK